MKKLLTIKNVKVPMMMALMWCLAVCAWAGDNFSAHWVSKLNPEMRLCDLSIPEAHDAATNYTCIAEWQDQQYDEKELFSRGVRAFDMRLYYGKAWHSFISGSMRTCFSHGGDDGPGGLYGYNMRDIDEEIDDHFPDASSLNGEFMMLFFQWEGDGGRPLADKLIPFNEFLKCLQNKYGMTAPDGTPRFIQFRKDLKVKDIKGKIILIASTNAYHPDNIDTKIAKKVPIARTVDSKSKPGSQIYTDGQIVSFDKDGNEIKEASARYFEQNVWGANKEDKKKKIKQGFENWFNYLSDPASKKNEECAFNKAQINSYAYPAYGAEICSDYKGTIGCNHYTADFLKDHHKPYGIVRFDFIGLQDYKERSYHGNDLLQRVLANNFEVTEFANFGNYMQDIVVVSCNRIEDARILLTSKGYALKTIYHTNAGLDNFSKFEYIGYKTTSDYDDAITDVVVVSATGTPPAELKWKNRTYHLAQFIQTDNSKQADYKGSITNGLKCTPKYLYYTKEPGDALLCDISILPESEDAKLLDANNQVEMLNVSYRGGSNIDLADCGKADVNKGAKNKDTKNNTVRIQCNRHVHSADKSQCSYEALGYGHNLRCGECNAVIKLMDHERTMQQDKGFMHSYACKQCGDKQFALCEMANPDVDVEFFKDYSEEQMAAYREDYSHGFGRCKVCGNLCTEAPALVTNNGKETYVISNAAQLYWYAGQVNYNGRMTDARLSADIDFSQNVPESLKWEPIGIDGYRATFDGKGHVITGLHYNGGKERYVHGFFGVLNGATVRNLGIVNSSFEGNGKAGVFAGEATDSHIENVFSTSYATYGNGIIAKAQRCTVENTFYDATQNGYAAPEVYSNNIINAYSCVDKKCHGGTRLTREQFVVGELCTILNEAVRNHNKNCDKDSQWNSWGQTLPEDTIPTMVQQGRLGWDYNKKITYKRINHDTWGTVMLPYKIYSSDAVELYNIKDILIDGEEGTLVLEKADCIEANTPCVFKRVGLSQEVSFACRGDFERIGENAEFTNEIGAAKLIGNYEGTILTAIKEYGYYDVKEDKFELNGLNGWDDRYDMSPFQAFLEYKPGCSVQVKRFYLENTTNCKKSANKRFSLKNTADCGKTATTDLDQTWTENVKRTEGKFIENGKVYILKNGVKYDLQGKVIGSGY